MLKVEGIEPSRIKCTVEGNGNLRVILDGGLIAKLTHR